MKNDRYRPPESSFDPRSLDQNLSKIQFWVNGVMLTLLPIWDAIEKAKNREAFVITSQAIGACDDEGFSIA